MEYALVLLPRKQVRCPKAQAMLHRINEIDLSLPMAVMGADGQWKSVNAEVRHKLNFLTLSLDSIVRSGRDIEAPFESEAEEMIARAERQVREAK